MSEERKFRKPTYGNPNKRKWRWPDEPYFTELGKRLRTRHPHEFIERLSAEQNHRCCYCGIRTNEWPKHGFNRCRTHEHVIPFASGGPDTYENSVMACQKCNVDRGKTFFEKKNKSRRQRKKDRKAKLSSGSSDGSGPADDHQARFQEAPQ